MRCIISAILEYLRSFHFGSVLLRLLLAVAAGGIIGYGRARKRRNAGLRTYMFVSLGAALTMLISLYEYDMLETKWLCLWDAADVKFDGTRYAAQVISGIGFLGGGTIILTGKKKLKGLTTAAGLWAAGIIGLAIGAGFYEGAIIAVILVLIVETLFFNIGSRIKRPPEIHMQVVYVKKSALDGIMRFSKDKGFSIHNLQVSGVYDSEMAVYTAVISMRSR